MVGNRIPNLIALNLGQSDLKSLLQIFVPVHLYVLKA